MFGFFRRLLPAKRPPLPPVSRLHYTLAYQVFPEHVFQKTEQFLQMGTKSVKLPGPYFLLRTASQLGVNPEQHSDWMVEQSNKLKWHRGELSDGRDYFVMEFPDPEPIDHLTEKDLITRFKDGLVLAPHFAGVIGRMNSAETQLHDSAYYVLGQRPLGGTTLRQVSKSGSNLNLDQGPPPQLKPFIECLTSLVGPGQSIG